MNTNDPTDHADTVDQTEPDESSKDNDAGQAPRDVRHTGHVVAAVVAAIVAVCASTAVVRSLNYRSNLHETALSTCQTQAAAVDDSMTALTKAIDDAATESAYTSDDVADPNTLNDLEDMLTRANALPDIPACQATATTNDLLDNASRLEIYNENVENLTRAVEIAQKAVVSSHTELENMNQ
ncbi:hypothetical protein [Bifidobacterium choloepi]|uniref:Uncharacterized protein n=1 Tax=Bifidobacterium choloepi TaxID=2614131 RepID=A0A6I5NFZ0_9BIFI|nr:hypothetical protein [Bifidobacterium choloepi]NEG70264.1 hypothetical protein [Bifidobacterium choloepi]